jgi:hypothetical protein
MVIFLFVTLTRTQAMQLAIALTSFLHRLTPRLGVYVMIVSRIFLPHMIIICNIRTHLCQVLMFFKIIILTFIVLTGYGATSLMAICFVTSGA